MKRRVKFEGVEANHENREVVAAVGTGPIISPLPFATVDMSRAAEVVKAATAKQHTQLPGIYTPLVRTVQHNDKDMQPTNSPAPQLAGRAAAEECLRELIVVSCRDLTSVAARVVTCLVAADRGPATSVEPLLLTCARRVEAESGAGQQAEARVAARPTIQEQPLTPADLLQTAGAARDFAYEKLYDGPWKAVPVVWRECYALACYMWALGTCFIHAAQPGGAGEQADDHLRSALRLCDLAILLGSPPAGTDPQALASTLQRCLRPPLLSAAAPPTTWQFPATAPTPARGEAPPPRIHCPSFVAFQRIVRQGHPVILTGTIDHWPAMTRWADQQYLRNLMGDRTVSVSRRLNNKFESQSTSLLLAVPSRRRLHGPHLNSQHAATPAYSPPHARQCAR